MGEANIILLGSGTGGPFRAEPVAQPHAPLQVAPVAPAAAPPAAAPAATPFRVPNLLSSAAPPRPSPALRSLGQTPPAKQANPTAQMMLSEATELLPGIRQGVDSTQDAIAAGFRCPDLSPGEFEQAKALKDRMVQFVAQAKEGSVMTVQSGEAAAAAKVIQCGMAYDNARPNTVAYYVLGAVLIGFVIAISV